MAYRSRTKLGILGGGQLGRMLIAEAIKLDVEVHILDPDADAPCRHICHSFTQGSFNDFEAVLVFGRELEVVTVEIENVNVDALEELEKLGVQVLPPPRVIRLVQDKGQQKQFYRLHGIPTSEFRLVEKGAMAGQTDMLPCFQKLRKGGYDGRGVVRLDSVTDMGKAFDAPSVVERLVDVKKEVSVIVARNRSGEMASFPLVELAYDPKANLVDSLFSPAEVDHRTELAARALAERVAEGLGMVGILAVEMFIDQKGHLLVNEVAPRPHNSGHQSIEGNVTSQYGQHLRCILGLPLGSTEIVRPSVMVNLLGAEGFEGEVIYEGLEEAMALPGVNVHLYGKKFTKPFRKMGHVTVTAETLEQARTVAASVRRSIKVKA